MKVLDKVELSGDLVLVLDEKSFLGELIEVDDVTYKVIDVDRFETDENHMVVVERE